MQSIHYTDKAAAQSAVQQFRAMGRQAFLLAFPDGRLVVKYSI